MGRSLLALIQTMKCSGLVMWMCLCSFFTVSAQSITPTPTWRVLSLLCPPFTGQAKYGSYKDKPQALLTFEGSTECSSLQAQAKLLPVVDIPGPPAQQCFLPPLNTWSPSCLLGVYYLDISLLELCSRSRMLASLLIQTLALLEARPLSLTPKRYLAKYAAAVYMLNWFRESLILSGRVDFMWWCCSGRKRGGVGSWERGVPEYSHWI